MTTDTKGTTMTPHQRRNARNLAAISKLASKFEFGELMLATDPTSLIESSADAIDKWKAKARKVGEYAAMLREDFARVSRELSTSREAHERTLSIQGNYEDDAQEARNELAIQRTELIDLRREPNEAKAASEMPASEIESLRYSLDASYEARRQVLRDVVARASTEHANAAGIRLWCERMLAADKSEHANPTDARDASIAELECATAELRKSVDGYQALVRNMTKENFELVSRMRGEMDELKQDVVEAACGNCLHRETVNGFLNCRDSGKAPTDWCVTCQCSDARANSGQSEQRMLRLAAEKRITELEEYANREGNKARTYEQNWYAAKAEFGEARTKLSAKIHELEAELATARATIEKDAVELRDRDRAMRALEDKLPTAHPAPVVEPLTEAEVDDVYAEGCKSYAPCSSYELIVMAAAAQRKKMAAPQPQRDADCHGAGNAGNAGGVKS